MERKLNRLFKLNDKHLERINQQRRRWLYASSIVFTGIIFLIFGWDWLDHFHNENIWWVVVSLALIISINWWYWTMRVVYKMLQHQKIEFTIIKELVSDIKEVKEEITKLGNQTIDKKK
jgi:small-conductance mechanosensitive channel